MLVFHIIFVVLLTSFGLVISSPTSNTCMHVYLAYNLVSQLNSLFLGATASHNSTEADTNSNGDSGQVFGSSTNSEEVMTTMAAVQLMCGKNFSMSCVYADNAQEVLNYQLNNIT